jgi:CrcB protein
MTMLMIALGAAVGAPLRYLVDRSVRRWHDRVFPWGTLTVNPTASLILGLLVGLGGHVGTVTYALVGTGFCATLSTYSIYSTYGYQTSSWPPEAPGSTPWST